MLAEAQLGCRPPELSESASGQPNSLKVASRKLQLAVMQIWLSFQRACFMVRICGGFVCPVDQFSASLTKTVCSVIADCDLIGKMSTQ